ncbi:MAG: response regulator [Thermotogae bacterium]|nr:response regulator [Thermotogota bacterium]
MPSLLIVDDEEGIRFGLSKALAKRGWEVLEASSVEEARSLLRTNPVEVILTDIRMESESGLIFLQEVKTIRPNTHVVVMTARGSPDMEREVLSLGAEAYLEKPFDLNYLDQLLKKILKRRGFKGVVQELSLIDILQLLSYEKGTAKVEVSSPEGKGALYVKDGILVHALFENVEGMEAFNRILDLEGGSFSVRRGEEPPKESVNEPLDALLLRVVTSKDEETDQTETAITLDNVDDWSFTASLGLVEEKDLPEDVARDMEMLVNKLKGVKGAVSVGVYAVSYDHLISEGKTQLPSDLFAKVAHVLRTLNREELFVDGSPNHYFRLKEDALLWIESEGTPLVVLRIEMDKVL